MKGRLYEHAVAQHWPRMIAQLAGMTLPKKGGNVDLLWATRHSWRGSLYHPINGAPELEEVRDAIVGALVLHVRERSRSPAAHVLVPHPVVVGEVVPQCLTGSTPRAKSLSIWRHRKESADKGLLVRVFRVPWPVCPPGASNEKLP